MSSSLDGTIKIYDGITSSCISTIPQAHGGHAVTSVEFSKDGRSILSTGLDSIGRIWDLSSTKCLTEFKGAAQSQYTSRMAFSYNESHVYGIDDEKMALTVWNSNGDKVQQVIGNWDLCSASETHCYLLRVAG